MNLQRLTLSLLTLFGFSTAYADDSVNALQNQINTLQNQINNLQNNQVALPSIVMSDFSNPFSAMSDTIFPLSIMQSKSDFKAPLILGGELEIDLQAWGGQLFETNQ